MVDYLLEVGTEELPASFIIQVLPQWEEQIPKALAEAGLGSVEMHFWATPRRLSMILRGLPAAQPDRVEVVKGPAVASAYNAQGQPTKALQGFARSKGVALENLTTQTTEKGAFVFAQVAIKGQSCGAVLQQRVPEWITGLEGKRLMRWADGSLRFSRPIRWLVSLLDQAILPIELEGLTSERTSYGHRVLAPEPLILTGAQDYEAQLSAAFVIVDPAKRKDQIREQLLATAQTHGAEVEIPEDLLTEVHHLVEWPSVVVGSFEEDFLTLPPPVIKTEMTSHQRYFPLHRPGQPQQLLPSFLSVSNGDPQYHALIARGNSRVLRARLWDGRFFYTEDRKQPLEAFLVNLETVTFQDKLGSLAQRVERIVKLAQFLANVLACTPQQTILIERTARLAKADLTTQMVKEFPELQGIMGYYYATADGEDPEVCLGIQEHYQPRFATDTLPTTLSGKVVALAERAELIASLFGIGQVPTGSSDPYALRRATLGMVQILLKNQFPLSLGQLLRAAQGQAVSPVLQNFYKQRLQGYLIEQEKLDYDLVNAVLEMPEEPTLPNLLARIQTLQAMRKMGILSEIYETVNRVIRLGSQATIEGLIAEVGLEQAITRTLNRPNLTTAEQDLENLIKSLDEQADHDQLVAYIRASVGPVSQFFSEVLVMVEDLELRAYRLNLLGILRYQYRLLADFSQVVLGGS